MLWITYNPLRGGYCRHADVGRHDRRLSRGGSGRTGYRLGGDDAGPAVRNPDDPHGLWHRLAARCIRDARLAFYRRNLDAAGTWMLMVHGDAFLQYGYQGGPRGADQLGSINWGMIMAMHQVGGGTLHLHGMASAEPLTIGARGYPLLLQSGETHQDQPLHDPQHPHDLFMELSALYERATLGYVREFARYRGATLGVGARGAINLIPRALHDVYGSRSPAGLAVFLRVRPSLFAEPHAMDAELHRNH